MGGASWTRNVVWRKGRFFVIIDEIEATKAGTFALECNWRTLGTPSLDGDRLEAVQRDPDSGREDRFLLEGVGGDRVTMERDWEAFGHWWKEYPYSDDFVNILRQSVSREMATGDRHTFINLFYATNDAKPLDVRMRRVGETAVLIEGSEGRMLVGTGGPDGAFAVGPISGEADVYVIGEGWFALCGGRRLLRGKTSALSNATARCRLRSIWSRALASRTQPETRKRDAVRSATNACRRETPSRACQPRTPISPLDDNLWDIPAVGIRRRETVWAVFQTRDCAASGRTTSGPLSDA